MQAGAALSALTFAGTRLDTVAADSLPSSPEANDGAVTYQYFHTPWSDIEADIGRLDAMGISAIWIQQPAAGKLRFEDLSYDGEYGFYDDERSPFGWRDPHPPLGYQPVDLRDFDSTLGTEAELESLIETCHDHGIEVIVDVVLNHMANPNGPEGTIDWPQFDEDADFHDNGTLGEDCSLQGEEAEYECDLLALPSLDVSRQHVQEAHRAYLEKIAGLGADGLRYDAAGHVWPWYFEQEVNPLADDLGLWRVAEVWDEGDVDRLLEFADTGMTVFDFPFYSAITDAFDHGSMETLSQNAAPGVVHERPEAAVTFVQNHDTVGPGMSEDEPEGRAVELAEAFILAYAGTPVLYRSDPESRPELEDEALESLIWVAQNLADGAVIDRHVDHDVYLFERDGNLLAGINTGEAEVQHTVDTSWAGETLVDHAGDASDIVVSDDGTVAVTIPGEAWVMYAPADDEEPTEPTLEFDATTYELEKGTTKTVDIGVSAGEDPITETLTISIDDETLDSSELEVEAGSSTTESLDIDVEDRVQGTYDLEASVAGMTAEATLTVTEESADTLEGTYRIVNVNSGKALDVEGVNSAENGANVQQWEDVGGDDQYWVLEAVGDDQYVIENVGTGRVLEVSDFGTDDGVNVQQWAWADVESQLWEVDPDGDSYVITNVLSGKALDVEGVSTENGANVHQWADVGGENQRWMLEE